MNLQYIANEFFQSDLMNMIINTGPIVKLVLAILLLFSVISWAIILYKLNQLRRIEKESKRFNSLFWDKRQFAVIYGACANYKSTPLARVFMAGYKELARIKKGTDPEKSPSIDEVRDNIQRAIRRTILGEVNAMEKAVTFLATTGNTTPFIGLFGTVWGIMNSFRSIGMRGAANLAVVAPGISEALIATAMGLVAAIPAVIAYNHITTRIGRITSEMDTFSLDLLDVVERYILREFKKTKE